MFIMLNLVILALLSAIGYVYGVPGATCTTGYRVNASGGCDDVDECRTGDRAACDSSSTSCVNSAGSYSCLCKPAFTRHSDTLCRACPPDFIELMSDGGLQVCYKFSDSAINFTQAETYCKQIHSALFTPTRFSLNSFLANQVRHMGIDQVWLGYVRDKDTAEWRWSSAVEGMTYDDDTTWNKYTPYLDFSKNCVALRPSVDGLWWNVDCSDEYRAVCQQNINECLVWNECAANNVTCWDTPFSYVCSCGEGYSMTDDHHCIDVDECSADATCSSNAKCTNTWGSYSCACPQGFVGDGYVKCSDIDECLNASVPLCDPLTTTACVNVAGTFRCECLPGYVPAPLPAWRRRRLIPVRTCVDRDECDEAGGGGRCGVGNRSRCQNHPGSFSCVCERGYEVTPDGRLCQDQDECGEARVCDTNTTTCRNTDGSYSCACRPGFQDSDAHTTLCHDHDECEDTTTSRMCDDGSHCRNTRGSFECVAKMSYDDSLPADPSTVVTETMTEVGIPVGAVLAVLVLIYAVIWFRHRRQVKQLQATARARSASSTTSSASYHPYHRAYMSASAPAMYNLCFSPDGDASEPSWSWQSVTPFGVIRRLPPSPPHAATSEVSGRSGVQVPVHSTGCMIQVQSKPHVTFTDDVLPEDLFVIGPPRHSLPRVPPLAGTPTGGLPVSRKRGRPVLVKRVFVGEEVEGGGSDQDLLPGMPAKRESLVLVEHVPQSKPMQLPPLRLHSERAKLKRLQQRRATVT